VGMLGGALANPLVMIASDGLIADGKGIPVAPGPTCACSVKFVREENALSLMDAIRKSSLMPAQRLESMSPQRHTPGIMRRPPGAYRTAVRGPS
jgi:hypothetical protein